MLFRTGISLAAVAALSIFASPLQAQTNQSGQIIFKTPQEAVRYYEDLVGQLCNQVKSMQDDNAKMVQVINDMQRQVQALNQEVASLKRQIAAESSARQEQMNTVVDKVSGAIRTATAQQQKAAAEEERSAAKAATEMIEVTVPAGATLGLIAKTYNVSLDDIRKANNLKSDTLRVGQKILVPKK